MLIEKLEEELKNARRRKMLMLGEEMRIVPITELSKETIESIHTRVRQRLIELMVKSGRAENEDAITLQDVDFNNPQSLFDLRDWSIEEPCVLKFRFPSNGFGTINYVGLRDPIKAILDKPPDFPTAVAFKTGIEGSNTKAAVDLHPLLIPIVEVSDVGEKLIYPCKGFLADPILYGPNEAVHIVFSHMGVTPIDFSSIIIGGTIALPWTLANAKNSA